VAIHHPAASFRKEKAMRDLYNSIAIKPVIAPAANANLGTTALVGSVVDSLGFGSVTYAIQTGALTDVDATYTTLLEESDAAGSGFAAVSDSDLLGTETAASFTFAADGVVRKLGYAGSKRYTRLTITPAGADSGNSPISALAILGHPATAPVA
jgi:hypothetical protein